MRTFWDAYNQLTGCATQSEAQQNEPFTLSETTNVSDTDRFECPEGLDAPRTLSSSSYPSDLQIMNYLELLTSFGGKFFSLSLL